MFLFIILIISFSSVRGDIRNCDNFYPSKSPSYKFNCTLICGLRFHVPPANETAVCEKGSRKPMSCASDKDCGRNLAAYCKQVSCYCETEPNLHPYYIYHPEFPRLGICVVPIRWNHPDMPLIPFPWLTLIVVIGILLLFGICLVVLKWMSPYLRRLQVKREGRDGDTGGEAEMAEASAFLAQVLQPVASRHSRIHSASHASQGGYRPSSSRRFHGRYSNWDRLDTFDLPVRYVVAEDKPPPYEVAIQMQPPLSGGEAQEHSSEHDPIPATNENSSRGTETSDPPTEPPLS